MNKQFAYLIPSKCTRIETEVAPRGYKIDKNRSTEHFVVFRKRNFSWCTYCIYFKQFGDEYIKFHEDLGFILNNSVGNDSRYTPLENRM